MENEKLEFSAPILTMTELEDFDHKITRSIERSWAIGDILELNDQ